MKHLLSASAIVLSLAFGAFALAKQDDAAKPDKDKTPPVISALGIDAVGPDSAIAKWSTDEPADSAIRYGVDPKTNIKGPEDAALTLSHALTLSGLAPATAYAFCVTSTDAANNKSESCGTFVAGAAAATPAGGGAGGEPEKPRVSISGFAYPGARMDTILQGLPFGPTIEGSTQAAPDGSFMLTFDRFPYGLYAFTLTATDGNGLSSARKGIIFESPIGGKPLEKEIRMPPTLSLSPAIVPRGGDLTAFGTGLPNARVAVEIGSIGYETTTDGNGSYSVIISTARFSPGTVLSVRARLASDSDYSPLKTVLLGKTNVLQADLNRDGAVDIRDLSMFLANPIDLNGDGKINAGDTSVFMRALFESR